MYCAVAQTAPSGGLLAYFLKVVSRARHTGPLRCRTVPTGESNGCGSTTRSPRKHGPKRNRKRCREPVRRVMMTCMQLVSAVRWWKRGSGMEETTTGFDVGAGHDKFRSAHTAMAEVEKICESAIVPHISKHSTVDGAEVEPRLLPSRNSPASAWAVPRKLHHPRRSRRERTSNVDLGRLRRIETAVSLCASLAFSPDAIGRSAGNEHRRSRVPHAIDTAHVNGIPQYLEGNSV